MTPLVVLLSACTPETEPPLAPPERAGEVSPPVGETAETGDTGERVGDTCDFDELDKIEALQRIIDGLSSDCEVAWYIDLLDQLESEPREGPWFEDLWVMETADASSFDVAASTKIHTGGAVPEAVLGEDGRTYLFFVEGDLKRARDVARDRTTWFRDHGLSGYGALDALVSDDGVSFEPLTDFRVEGIVRGMVADPDVIRLPDGRWRMYYVGMPVTELDETGELGDIIPQTAFYAESDDLVNWTQVGVAAEGPDADPSVHCFDDANCLMVSTGMDWSTSTDGGRTFEFQDLDEPPAFAPELVELDHGALRLFYNSKVVGGALESMLSEDGGLTWTWESERVGICLVEAVSLVARPEGGWLVYYHYWQNGWSGSDFSIHAGDPDYEDPCDEVDDPRD